jgi:hypothetical protein
MSEAFDQYLVMREMLIKTTIFFSRKMTAFAMLEEQSDLQGLCSIHPDELLVIEDNDLLKKCDAILVRAKAFIKDLVEYGIDEPSLSSYGNLVNQFKQISNTKEQFISASTNS